MKPGMLATVLVAALAVAACAPQGDEDPVPTPTVTRTVITKAAVPLPALPHGAVEWPAPPVSVDANTVHVGARSYDIAPLHADSAVSTRGGVYFLNAGELWHLDEHGAVGTGFARLTRLVVSGDGRYLGLVDRNHGPVGAAQVQIATAVVYDTTTGTAVVHSRAGMRSTGPDGDTDAADDSAELGTRYREDPPEALGFEDGALIASTPRGAYAYPISGARPHPQH